MKHVHLDLSLEETRRTTSPAFLGTLNFYAYSKKSPLGMISQAHSIREDDGFVLNPCLYLHPNHLPGSGKIASSSLILILHI